MGDILVRFRIGASDLKLHRLRYSKDNLVLNCPLCSSRLDDEVHFVFMCPRLNDLRKKYIPAKYTLGANPYDALNYLLNDVHAQLNVARYIYYSLKYRDECKTA